MKKIEAIIKPFRLNDVEIALDEAGIDGMTVSEVKNFGRQQRHAEVFRGTEYMVDSLPEIKIELVISDSLLEAAVAAIVKGSRTSQPGEGKVFVSQIDDALQSRAQFAEQTA